jgi:hypothetical protein
VEEDQEQHRLLLVETEQVHLFLSFLLLLTPLQEAVAAVQVLRLLVGQQVLMEAPVVVAMDPEAHFLVVLAILRLLLLLKAPLAVLVLQK